MRQPAQRNEVSLNPEEEGLGAISSSVLLSTVVALLDHSSSCVNVGSAVRVAVQLKQEVREVLPASDAEYAQCSVRAAAVAAAGSGVTAILQSEVQ